MGKVLFIAFAFPPHPHIGAQRPYGLVKYFSKYGWESVVLTIKRPEKPHGGLKLIETDYARNIVSRIKLKTGFDFNNIFNEQLKSTLSKESIFSIWKNKSVKFLREAIKFPDEQKGWLKFAIRSASEYIDRATIDIIISTSAPVTSHLIARRLKKKYKIPWIADLRDLWTQNHFYNKSGLIKFFEKGLELKTLSDADAIVTVTHRFAEQLKTLHKDKKIFCITNGYDPDDFSQKPVKLTDKFTITYTGKLYDGKMDPSLLLKVILNLIIENKINKELIEIRFYCQNEHWLIEEIKRHGLEGVVNYYGFLRREAVLEKQKESQLLLLLLDKNTEVDYYPAKVFEYFGARRPIITIGRRGGIVGKLLEETNAGIFINSYDSLRKSLIAYYEEYVKFGKIQYKGNTNVENYTYRLVAERYTEVLNECIR